MSEHRDWLKKQSEGYQLPFCEGRNGITLDKWKKDSYYTNYSDDKYDERFNLLLIAPDLIVLEYDIDDKKLCDELIAKSLEKIKQDNVCCEVYEHQGRCKHVHLNCDSDFSKEQKEAVLKKYAVDDRVDMSLAGEKLCAVPFAKHWKNGKIKELVQKVDGEKLQSKNFPFMKIEDLTSWTPASLTKEQEEEIEKIKERLTIPFMLKKYGYKIIDDTHAKCKYHEMKNRGNIGYDKDLYQCFHPGCDNKGDIFNLIMKEEDCNFPEAIEKSKEISNETTSNKIDYITAKELYESEIEEPEWLVDKIISKKGITMFAGEQASSKSLLALHIAFCVATGESVLGKYPVKKGRVLYIDEENREIGMKDRYVRIIKGTDDKTYDLNIDFLICKNVKLDEQIVAKRIAEYIEERNPDLIICDSMVRMMTKDEDKAKDVRKIFDVIKNLDTSWLLLHHTRKTGNSIKDVRGSSDFVNMCDNVFSLVRRQGLHTFALRQEKSRGATFVSGVEYQILGSENTDPINFKFLDDLKSERAEAGENLAEDVEI